MENLKIRVHSAEESKEAQELFFELGFKKVLPDVICFSNDVKAVCAIYGSVWINNILFDSCSTNLKEITLPQLKDIVILKRNDVKDATHIRGDGKKYFHAKSTDYYYQFSDDKEWLLSTWMNYQLLPQLKPIEKQEMKEYLDKDYVLRQVKQTGGNNRVPSGWIEVPEWANYAYDNDLGVCFLKGAIGHNHPLLIWQRESLNDKVASAEVARQKHNHYKKDVSHLKTIDVYRVLGLFDVDSHEVGHAIKKLLCSGQRGSKDHKQDVQEAIDSLNRHLEMLSEVEAS